MRAFIDQDLCISCGTCVDLCPEVFDWNENEKACVVVNEIPADLEDEVSEAIESCPTTAISEH